MSETLGYRLLRSGARAPVRTRPGDAAFDLLTDEAFTLEPGKRHRATTGVSIALQPEWAGLVVPRSGLAANHGITLLNAPGLIDPNYRGELMVVMHNAGDEPYEVHAGDRVAQLLIVRFAATTLVELEELPPPPDDRAHQGFGSSGR
jgi:dUTP pyrophosphatase